jgi:hypothetical protein
MRKTSVESMMIMVQIIRFLCGREGGKNRAGKEQKREIVGTIETD